MGKGLLLVLIFCGIIAGVRLVEAKFSTDDLQVFVEQITIEGGRINRIPFDLESSELKPFGHGAHAEVLSISYERTLFPGTAYLEVSLAKGAVIAREDGHYAVFRQNAKNCHKTSERTICRMRLARGRAETRVATLVPFGAGADIEYIEVISVAQHQLLWPTHFSVISLVLAFLPIAMAIGFLQGHRERQAAILVSSLLFVGALSFSLMVLLATFVVGAFGVLFMLSRGIVSLPGALALWVAAILGVKLIWPLIGVSLDLPLGSILLPIGFGYLIARQVDAAFKLTSGQIAMPRFDDFACFNLFWPSLAAGPITQISVVKLLDRAYANWAQRSAGLTRIFFGLAKKTFADLVFLLLVAENYESVVILGTASPSVVLAFFFGNMIFVYLDFSGYTDMALGSARLMGIALPENFKNPLLKSNMREFWRAWHMTLTQWVNRSVYMPLSISLRREIRIFSYSLPIVATTMTMGLWHGLQFVWVLWALHHAIGIFITDFAARIIQFVRKRSFALALALQLCGRWFGFVFVWFWLMLSYCFTLSTNDIISLNLYKSLLYAPIEIFISRWLN